MSDNSVKSLAQLQYELDKIKNERISLLNNWKKKKEESSARMLGFRAELKEIDAVIAAREEGYTAFRALANPILNLANPGNLSLPPEPESLLPELTGSPTKFLNQIFNFTQAAETAETNLITRLRGEHQTQSTYIQGKSKEIYVSMSEEKKSVDQYAVLLQAKIQELEEQYAFQNNKGEIAIEL